MGEEESCPSSAPAGPAADNLPVDILNRIQRLLPIEDYVRFPAVCSSWRSAANQNPNLHSNAMPWLFTHALDDPYFVAYRPSPNNDLPIASHTVPILPTPHSSIISSIGPRLLLCDLDANTLVLVNPFSPTTTNIHPLPVDIVSQHRNSIWYLWKVVAPPDYNGRNGIAVALLHPVKSSAIAYTMSGGPWIDLSNSDNLRYYEDGEEHHDILPDLRFIDALHYKDALFFALQEDKQTVIALDFSLPSPKLIDMTFNLVDDHLSVVKTYRGSYTDARLVLSPPYLYLVRWMLISTFRHDTVRVYVYRLTLPNDDDHMRRWVRVNELGGCSFFLGHNESMSLAVRDFPGLRPDRIYLPFQNEQFDRSSVEEALDEEEMEAIREESGECFVYNLIYNLRDGSWEKYCGWDGYGYEFYSRIGSWSSRWMMPRLL